MTRSTSGNGWSWWTATARRSRPSPPRLRPAASRSRSSSTSSTYLNTCGRPPGPSSTRAKPASEEWVADQARKILHGKASPGRGRDPPPRHRLRLLPAAERAGADEAARYLGNKQGYLGYATALAKGWPIATGIIEGACRHIVKDRMDITGARWGLEQALAKTGKSIAAMITAFSEQLLTIDELRARMPALRARETGLKDQIATLDAQAADRDAYLKLAGDLEGFLARLRGSSATATVEDRQRVLRAVVQDILVGPEKITIRHRIPVREPSGGGHHNTTDTEGDMRESSLLRWGRDLARPRESLHALRVRHMARTRVPDCGFRAVR